LVLASLVSEDEEPDRFIWLELWDLATPPAVQEDEQRRRHPFL
jgi:hypothetical protein